MNLTTLEQNVLDFLVDALELTTLYDKDGLLNIPLVHKLKREGYLTSTFGSSN